MSGIPLQIHTFPTCQLNSYVSVLPSCNPIHCTSWHDTLPTGERGGYEMYLGATSVCSISSPYSITL
uniref:Uncharacterized protein n=1 Tax=Rhizophora mucronata TaxID=61149 RepID=A0A2P2N372_RHIMU